MKLPTITVRRFHTGLDGWVWQVHDGEKLVGAGTDDNERNAWACAESSAGVYSPLFRAYTLRDLYEATTREADAAAIACDRMAESTLRDEAWILGVGEREAVIAALGWSRETTAAYRHVASLSELWEEMEKRGENVVVDPRPDAGGGHGAALMGACDAWKAAVAARDELVIPDAGDETPCSRVGRRAGEEATALVKLAVNNMATAKYMWALGKTGEDEWHIVARATKLILRKLGGDL